MPNVDASDYIRRTKLAAIQYGNQGANQQKFRVLTRFDSYDPSTVRATGALCNDVCITTPKNHNIFAAQKYSANRVPHFFRRSGETITITIPDGFCGSQAQIDISGGYYTIINNSGSETFEFFPPGQRSYYIQIPTGTSQRPLPTGIIFCQGF